MNLIGCKKLFSGLCTAGLITVITLTVLAGTNYDSRLSSHWKTTAKKYHMVQQDDTATIYNRAEKKHVYNDRSTHKEFTSPTKLTNTSLELSKDDINSVKTFVFFIGYPRSGHSIVGSFMDAHPNMIISHEFMLFKRWITDDRLRNKTYLFNELYKDSYKDATVGLRTKGSNAKGYSLNVGFPWQGRYDQLLIIGDKSGGMTTFKFMDDSARFKRHYQQLVETVKIPVKVIHVVRNPYDIISTSTLYKHGGPKFVASQKALFQSNNVTAKQFHSERTLLSEIENFFKRASAVQEMIEYIKPENVLEIHNCDVVMKPKNSLQRICSFLQVDSPRDYLEAVERKVFKQVSKSRLIVEWPLRLKQVVEYKKRTIPFLTRYTFDGNI